MLETNEKIENLSKEIGNIKKNQMKGLELKNTVTKIKISKHVLKSRLKRQMKESVKWKEIYRNSQSEKWG